MLGWSHAQARVGMASRGGLPDTTVQVHLWMRGRRTVGFVNGVPRWACKAAHRRAAWLVEHQVRGTLATREDYTHA